MLDVKKVYSSVNCKCIISDLFRFQLRSAGIKRVWQDHIATLHSRTLGDKIRYHYYYWKATWHVWSSSSWKSCWIYASGMVQIGLLRCYQCLITSLGISFIWRLYNDGNHVLLWTFAWHEPEGDQIAWKVFARFA